MDIVLAMDPVSIIRTFAVLAEAGYAPVVPVTPEEFANRDSREGSGQLGESRIKYLPISRADRLVIYDQSSHAEMRRPRQVLP